VIWARTITSVLGRRHFRQAPQFRHCQPLPGRPETMYVGPPIKIGGMATADKTSNLRSPAKSPPSDWGLERKREYLAWAKEVVQGLRGINTWLEARFDEAAEQLGRSLR
jgi:hypothetical protein